MGINIFEWKNVTRVDSKQYICGHCGNSLVSDQGYEASSRVPDLRGYIYICHYCSFPTFFGIGESQIPGPIYGNSVKDVPDKNVESLYDEARKCMSCNAFTAAVLSCRKLLMNLGVSKGAKEGLPFIDYVEYLSNKGFVPPNGKDWVDHIRKKGNEANHEIAVMKREDAEELIDFIEMLLKFIYEFPATVKKKIQSKK